MTEDSPLLDIRGLEKHFTQSATVVDELRELTGSGRKPDIRAVDDVSLTIDYEDVQGVIGESGCGKTTLLLTLAGAHDPTSGDIIYKGKPVSEFRKSDWQEYRQNVQVVFQDPFNSMNPTFTVGETVREPLNIHGLSYDKELILETLSKVRLNPPEEYIDRRESQLSGGEKQRVAIARSLVVEPEMILADEPVSMLDVSTQAAILNLINELTEEYGLSVLYVSHDLSTVSYICQQIHVMYLGRVVESSETRQLLDDPKHPYTKELINAIPVPDPLYGRDRTQLPGDPGDPSDLPSGCRFKDRCPEAMEICDIQPLFTNVDDEHNVACHLHYDHGEISDTREPIAVTCDEETNDLSK